jgi:hypothetical protein
MHGAAQAAIALVLAVSNVASGEEPIDEVVVSGARIEQLRSEVARLDDAFNARYNALNTVRDFRIRCKEEAATGTRFRRRICRPAFQDEAEGEHARGFVNKLNTGGSSPSAQLAISLRNEAFRDNVETLTRSDAMLSTLAEERAKAQAKLDAAQRGALGKRAPESPQ